MKNKKKIWKNWPFLLSTIIVFIMIFSGILYFYFFHYVRMSPTMLTLSEEALETGVTLTDPEGDFQSMGGGDEKQSKGRPNNPESYKLPYNDIKEVKAGMDDEYLYVRVNFWGKFPTKPEVIGDDKIKDEGLKFNLTDKNGEDLAILCPGIDYAVPFLSMIREYYFYEPTGIKEPENKRFAHQDSDGKVAGGPGYDYVLAAFPTKKLGIKKGDTIYFNFSVEASSKKYDHAAVDVLGGTWKQGDTFVWKTDTNKADKIVTETSGKNDSGKNENGINDFDSCAKKYPVMETYPEQCRTPDGKTYTKK